jgi:uncharacterized membrane protein
MKKYLLTGLIILLPVVLTTMVIIFLFNFFTTPFAPLVSHLLNFLHSHFSITLPAGFDRFITRLLALILLCIFVLFLGMVARWFLVRNLIKSTYAIVTRIPFVKSIFKMSRDVFSALFAQEGKKAFKYPVMIPFPDRPNHWLGFVVGDVPNECQSKSEEKLVAVFTPTAPHPISGFLFFVPEKDIYQLDMTNEDAVRFIISCGMIVPEDKK